MNPEEYAEAFPAPTNRAIAKRGFWTAYHALLLALALFVALTSFGRFQASWACFVRWIAERWRRR